MFFFFGVCMCASFSHDNITWRGAECYSLAAAAAGGSAPTNTSTTPGSFVASRPRRSHTSSDARWACYVNAASWMARSDFYETKRSGSALHIDAFWLAGSDEHVVLIGSWRWRWRTLRSLSISALTYFWGDKVFYLLGDLYISFCCPSIKQNINLFTTHEW